MNIKVVSDAEVLQEGLEVLMNNLEPSKVIHFWAACQERKRGLSQAQRTTL